MDYDQRFELQVHAASQNECGDVKADWTTVYKGWCAVRSLGSSEYWQARAVQEKDVLKVFCRWHPSMSVGTRKARLVWRGCVMDLKSVENVDMRGERCVMRAEVTGDVV